MTPIKLSPPSSMNSTPTTPFGEYGSPDVEWDLPPSSVAPVRLETEATDTKPTIATATEDNVTNDDLGDLKTWLLIGGMFLIGLLVAVAAYLLPFGQHCVVPPIKVY